MLEMSRRVYSIYLYLYLLFGVRVSEPTRAYVVVVVDTARKDSVL